MPHAHTASNTKLALIACALLTLTFLAIWLASPPVNATRNPFPTTTNFICEIGGQWSNEHYNIGTAKRLTYAQWAITYRDGGTSTTYLQRPGEDCHTETYSHARPPTR